MTFGLQCDEDVAAPSSTRGRGRHHVPRHRRRVPARRVAPSRRPHRGDRRPLAAGPARRLRRRARSASGGRAPDRGTWAHRASTSSTRSTRSLRRLGTDYVDLYQLHIDDPTTPIDETLRALDDVVRAGKVRYVGCSNFLAYQLARAIGRSEARGLARFDSVQPRYNLLFRQIERELLPLCAGGGRRRHPVQPARRRPAHRASTGTTQARPRARASRSAPPPGCYQERYWHEREFDTVDALRPLAAEAGMPMATLARSRGCSPTRRSPRPIIGASRPDQLADDVAAVDMTIEPGYWIEELDSLTASTGSATARPRLSDLPSNRRASGSLFVHFVPRRRGDRAWPRRCWFRFARDCGCLPSLLEIVLGIAVGPSSFGLGPRRRFPVGPSSLIGLSFLLFLAGLRLDVGCVRDGSVECFVVYRCSAVLALIARVIVDRSTTTTALFVAIIVASTSLGLVVPVLRERGETFSPFGQLVLAGSCFARRVRCDPLGPTHFYLGERQAARPSQLLLLIGFSILVVTLAFALTRIKRSPRFMDTLVRSEETSARLGVRLCDPRPRIVRRRLVRAQFRGGTRRVRRQGATRITDPEERLTPKGSA